MLAAEILEEVVSDCILLSTKSGLKIKIIAGISNNVLIATFNIIKATNPPKFCIGLKQRILKYWIVHQN